MILPVGMDLEVGSWRKDAVGDLWMKFTGRRLVEEVSRRLDPGGRMLVGDL